jgi:hypothetical protein
VGVAGETVVDIVERLERWAKARIIIERFIPEGAGRDDSEKAVERLKEDLKEAIAEIKCSGNKPVAAACLTSSATSGTHSSLATVRWLKGGSWRPSASTWKR